MKFINHISWENRKNTGIAAFVCLFLIVFTPFDIQQWDYPERLYYVLGYGLCTLLGMYAWDVLKPTIAHALPSLSPAKRQVIYSFSVVLIISLFNFVYSFVIGVIDLSLQSFLIFAGITLAVGIFPSVWLFYEASRKEASPKEFSPKDISQKVRMTERRILKEQVQHPAESSVTLQGDNQDEILTVAEDDLIFIKAALNYSEVFYLKDDHLQREILRISMNRVEEQLDHPYIFRTHRSYICNLQKVESVTRKNKGLQLIFSDIEEPAYCSRKYKSGVNEKLSRLQKTDDRIMVS